MLLAAEGGGFFSASASGYRKCLTLLLLGHQKKEDKPKNSLSCASLICFGRTSAGLDTPSPLKVGPAQLQETPNDTIDTFSDKGKNDVTDEDDNDVSKVVLKSNMKKSVKGCAAAATHKSSEHNRESIVVDAEHVERRKVQWLDACGSELFQIRVFEPSETGASDDELHRGNEKSCSCSIM